MQDQPLNPTFLDTMPKGTDLFEGKSQEKIAEVIVNVIQKENFKIIGIDGGWGSGKSNLVKIIEKKLPKHNFFIYDVWGHQEDDQRKAILVELTDYITNTNKDIISNKLDWAIKLKKLLAKEKEVTTLNIPYLSVGFIFSLLSIVYVPTVNVFKDDLDNYFNIKSIFWKLLLVAFPIFIVLGIYIYSFYNFWRNKSGFLKSFKLAAQDTFQVYTNKQKEETKIEIISDNEPSVKDFRKWMTDIDNDLKDKKLVIVFDNFDRLPKKQILSIWSSIHIFFAEEMYKNIKVIIPFDRLHINNAFKELNANDTTFASDYINKTFDLVYRVSPPILSDWKRFLKKCWIDSRLPDDEKELNAVLQIFETFKSVITPREIIIFINDIVSNKLINSLIPERYIAIFVLKSDEILEDPLSAITNPDFLVGLSYKYADDENFQRYITALSYQINPENSLEIAYRKQLKTALVNNDRKVLSRISQTNIFSEIVLSVLDELENYENPVLSLNDVIADAVIDETRTEVLWENLFLKCKNIPFQKFDLPEFQRILAIRVASPFKIEQYKSILEKLKNNTQPFNSILYADIVDELFAISDKNSPEINITDILEEISITPESFVELVQSKNYKYLKYKLFCSSEDLDNYLIEVKNSNLNEYKYLSNLKKEFKLPKFREYVLQSVNENKLQPQILASYLEILLFVSHEKVTIPLADSEIYNYLTGSHFAQIIIHSTAMWIARGSNFSSSYPINPTLPDMSRERLIVEVSKTVELYVDFHDLLLDSINMGENEFYQKVIQSAISSDNPYRKLDLNKVLLNFDQICIVNNLNPQDLISQLNQYFSDGVILSINEYPVYYFSEIIKNSTLLAKESINSIFKHYDTIDKTEWLNIFKNLLIKDIEILKIVNYTKWNSYATSALKEYLLFLIENYETANKELIEGLIQNFEHSKVQLTNTFKDVRDELILKRNITPEIFVLFSKWLVKDTIWKDRANDVARTIIIPNLLDDANSFSLLNIYREEIKAIIAFSDNGATADFLSAVSDRMEINVEFAEFAEFLGLQNHKK